MWFEHSTAMLQKICHQKTMLLEDAVFYAVMRYSKTNN
jgi:hypothetical protein